MVLSTAAAETQLSSQRGGEMLGEKMMIKSEHLHVHDNWASSAAHGDCGCVQNHSLFTV